MLDRLRDYMVGIVAAFIALVFLLGVVLSLTVWKPAQEVVATSPQQHPLVMTRERVLPLLANEVVVTVKAGPSDHVALVYGATSDVRGWIHDADFTEIIGLEAGYEKLMVEGHEAFAPSTGESPQSGDAAQSDATQSGAQSATRTPQSGQQSGDHAQSGDSAQSGDQAQSGSEVTERLASNDMWVNAATGIGEAHLRLSDIQGEVSVLAASSGENPTLTLTWAVRSTNLLLIFSSIFAALFGAFAVFSLLRQMMLERSRVARAAQIEARQNADVTDTTTLSVEDIAAYGEQHEAAQKESDTEPAPNSFADTADGEPADLPGEDQEGNAVDDAGRDNANSAQTHVMGDSADSDGHLSQDVHAGQDVYAGQDSDQAEELSDTSSDVQGDDAPEFDSHDDTYGDNTYGDDTQGDDTQWRDAAPEDEDDSTFAGHAGHTAGEQRDHDGAATDDEEPHIVARHASLDGPIDADPPETVPTDTGTIDLSSIRPGAILPSRRALREARERGEASVVIDGQEFDTGLIPRITRVDAEEIQHLTAIDTDKARAHVDEYIYDSSSDMCEETKPLIGDPRGSGGWTSMMTTWMRGRKNDGDNA